MTTQLPNRPLNRTELAGLVTFWRERPGVSFSVGVSGVTAEFHAVPGERTVWTSAEEGITGTCSQASIEIVLEDGILAVPFDLASRRPGHRVRGCLLCKPDAGARMAGNRKLRHADSEGDVELFDVGAGAATVDALIMVDDPELVAALDEAEGERIVGTHHPALVKILEASPPRCFRSALARIIVTAPIATSKTSEGPHTHLLPNLIDGTTHDQRIGVPAGWLPCLAMHIPDSDPAFSSLHGHHP